MTPHEWSPDASWKERVFTKAQPFLSEDATAQWRQRKQAYRDQRVTGTV